VLLESGYPLLTQPQDDDGNGDEAATAAVSGDKEEGGDEMPVKVRVEHLLGAVLDCIKFPRKEVNEAASHVSGLVMQRIAQSTAIAEASACASLSAPGSLQLPMVADCCADFSAQLQGKLEAKMMVKGGADSLASCLCAISRHAPEFMQRGTMMKIMYVFRRLTPRGKYEFLQALDRSNAPSIHGTGKP
jgi:hypothetical protein